MRLVKIAPIILLLLLIGCNNEDIVEEKEERIYLKPINAYGVELKLGETISNEALEMIYDFYISKASYNSDIAKKLYPYYDYIENYDDYKKSLSDDSPIEYPYSWFLLMGGQKKTGEYIGMTVYNTTDDIIEVQEGSLTNFYAILNEYSSISYEGLKYGSSSKNMINNLGEYDSYFVQEDEDYGYDSEYNYNYNDGETFLRFRFKDDKLVSITASDIVDTKKIINEYEEKLSK